MLVAQLQANLIGLFLRKGQLRRAGVIGGPKGAAGRSWCPRAGWRHRSRHGRRAPPNARPPPRAHPTPLIWVTTPRSMGAVSTLVTAGSALGAGQEAVDLVVLDIDKEIGRRDVSANRGQSRRADWRRSGPPRPAPTGQAPATGSPTPPHPAAHRWRPAPRAGRRGHGPCAGCAQSRARQPQAKGRQHQNQQGPPRCPPPTPSARSQAPENHAAPPTSSARQNGQRASNAPSAAKHPTARHPDTAPPPAHFRTRASGQRVNRNAVTTP